MHSAGFGEGNGSIFLDNLVCGGDESSLLNCASDVAIGDSNCQHSEDAGVKCEGNTKTLYNISMFYRKHNYYIYHFIATCEESSVRLVVAESQYYYTHPNSFPSSYFIKDELHRGRVEICTASGEFKPLVICDESWQFQDASVVCRDIGFSAFGMWGDRFH